METAGTGKKLNCEKCGQTLTDLHWSAGKDISVCNNIKCLAFHNPVPTCSFENGLMANTSAKQYEEQNDIQTPLWLKSRVSLKSSEEQGRAKVTIRINSYGSRYRHTHLLARVLSQSPGNSFLGK